MSRSPAQYSRPKYDLSMEITLNLTLKLDPEDLKTLTVVDKVVEQGGKILKNVEIAQEVDDEEEVQAAIAMALYELHNDSSHHDWEDTILTIDKVKKDYSPWSSKIYGLREIPVLRKR